MENTANFVKKLMKDILYDCLRFTGVAGILGSIGLATFLTLNDQEENSIETPKPNKIIEYSTDPEIQAHCPQPGHINKKTISYKDLPALAIDNEYFLVGELPNQNTKDSTLLLMKVEKVRNALRYAPEGQVNRVTLNLRGGDYYIHDKLVEDIQYSPSTVITQVSDIGHSSAFTLAAAAPIRFSEIGSEYASHGSVYTGIVQDTPNEAQRIQELVSEQNNTTAQFIRDQSTVNITEKCTGLLFRMDHTIYIKYTADDVMDMGLLEAYFNRATQEITYNADNIEFASNGNIINLNPARGSPLAALQTTPLPSPPENM